MSYAKSAMGDGWAFLVETVAKTAGASVEAGAGKYAKGARTARNVEQAARAELQAAQVSAQGAQQAAQITAEGQVAATQARIEAEKKATEKRNKMILVGSAALAGVLVLGFVGYRLTRAT
jgi:hypothetical protein